MSKKNVYEIFDEFRLAKTKTERLDVLKKNSNYALLSVLKGAMDDKIVFVDMKIPEYRHDTEIPPGMSYSNMTEELRRVYLFVKDNPKTPSGLTEKRRTEILIQILESLEKREAEVFVAMLEKDLKIPYLTPALVNEAFPQLLS